MGTFARGLRCSHCGAAYALDPLWEGCPACRRDDFVYSLEVEYDEEAQRQPSSSKALFDQPGGVYRFVGQRGEFRDRAYQDQLHRASCLHLLVAAIAAWMTPYLSDAIDAMRAELGLLGEARPPEHYNPFAGTGLEEKYVAAVARRSATPPVRERESAA